MSIALENLYSRSNWAFWIESEGFRRAVTACAHNPRRIHLRRFPERASLASVSRYGRYGELRASDQDRDQTIERLHRAATEGRIAAEELEQRVSTALKARTYGELEKTVEDLPGRRSGHGAPSPARRTAGGWAVSAVRANPMLLLLAIPGLAVTAALLLAATIVWAVLIVVIMVVGGRHGAPRPPWTYARRHGYRPSRRGPGGYWA
jgi:Domain of unknown function (DUF1707)